MLILEPGSFSLQLVVWIGGLVVRGWFPSYPQQEPGVQIQKPPI